MTDNTATNIFDDTYRRLDISGAVTGAAAISKTVTPADDFEIVGFFLKLSAAPTTSENFTVTIDMGIGATYDVKIYDQDLSAISATDIVQIFDKPIPAAYGSSVVFAYTNTDTRTYGLTPIIRNRI